MKIYKCFVGINFFLFCSFNKTMDYYGFLESKNAYEDEAFLFLDIPNKKQKVESKKNKNKKAKRSSKNFKKIENEVLNKLYHCTYSGCNNIYKTKGWLNAHISSKHLRNVSKEFMCPYPDCIKAYKGEYGLKIHINAKHLKIVYPCPYPDCKFTTSYPSNVRNHEKQKHLKIN